MSNTKTQMLKSGKEASDKNTAVQVSVALNQNELLIRVSTFSGTTQIGTDPDRLAKD